MKELVVISGKGGTGKTSLTACLAALTEDKVLADCDVEAPDLHLLLAPAIQQREAFIGGTLAHINSAACTGCGQCIHACRFRAISLAGPANEFVDYTASIHAMDCEGCAACTAVCATYAITMQPRTTGEWYVSTTRFGPMVHARLQIGQGNSGKLVSQVRREARRVAKESGAALVLTDGPPGIGCPVIASIGGATLVLIVVEPTVSSVHDLRRAAEMVRHFRVPGAVCLNKCDLAPELADEVEAETVRLKMPLLGRIPYDETIVESQLAAASLIEHAPESPAGRAVCELHAVLMQHLAGGNGHGMTT
ncbi:MAG: ATP-binding protein [Phycisphaerae bacterium]|nr:ATP-binding protein [Phycisphaerae bacterium]